MLTPEPVPTPEIPPQNSTYSQAVRMGGLLFVSGQLGTQPGGSLPEDFQEQTRQAICSRMRFGP